MSKINIKTKSLSAAGVLAYILIVLNTVSGFILSPFLLKCLGESVYGVYTTMNSFTSALTIVDVGVTQTLIRYISNYRARNKSDEEISKLCHTVKIVNYCVCGICVFVSIGLFFVIPSIYSNSFNVEELKYARTIYFFFAGSIVFTLLSNYYAGIISGYEYFTFINVTKTIRIFLRILSTFLFVGIFKNVYCLVTIELILSVLNWLVYFIFEKKTINVKKTKQFVAKIFLKEISIYTFLIFIQSIVDQVNNNLDNVFIGALVGASAVAIYSFGLSLFHIFQNLSTSISQMLIPYMSNKIENGATNHDLEDELIKIGKIQFLIIGAVFFCFFVLGKRFIVVWLGNDYINVYYIALILMSGGIVPLIQNGAIAILKAKNMLGFRTTMLFIMAIINAILTFFFVKGLGYVYAAVGTTIGFVFVNVIIMDFYYYKALKINMLKVLYHVIVRILPCNIVTAVITYCVSLFLPQSFIMLALLMIIYLMIYLLLLLIVGLNKNDKEMLMKRFVKKGEQ